jgi:hypothetical protein
VSALLCFLVEAAYDLLALDEVELLLAFLLSTVGDEVVVPVKTVYLKLVVEVNPVHTYLLVCFFFIEYYIV